MYILFRDDYKIHKDIPALPFSRRLFHVRKPYNATLIETPVTIGDHLKNTRIKKRLLQKDVAAIIGVTEDCITNWENNRAAPLIHHYPKIIAFLEFNPWFSDKGKMNDRIKQYRVTHGLSYKKMGLLLDVDGSTIREWELHAKEIKNTFTTRLKALLAK